MELQAAAMLQVCKPASLSARLWSTNGKRSFLRKNNTPDLRFKTDQYCTDSPLAAVLASPLSGAPNPPTPNAWPTPAAITAAGVTNAVIVGRRGRRSTRPIAASDLRIARRCVMLNNQPFIANKDAGAFAQAIVDTVREPLLVLDNDLRVLAASRPFYLTFRFAPTNIQGRRSKMSELF